MKIWCEVDETWCRVGCGEKADDIKGAAELWYTYFGLCNLWTVITYCA